MSSIPSDASFNAASFDRLGGHVGLDDLRAPQGGGLPAAEGHADPLRGPQADPGEDILNLAAWDGVAAGDRLLSGDVAFEARLSAIDLAQAVDQGTDAILDALA
ncbi:hypothetical protein CNR27_01745 [Luteimonas chenhongjianii]|uniref:Uncharacterized protein n=1 Tax=Luteimonas chenhongjianii TaxID=2006110 RepID=A0A290XAZ1_9GAMM|nr:hypothetical protein [Luteimonas chenhongjianii]ATD66325.1 hypothetical protein CNR27_01745 [Luteimonas chenhongjianii]